jgi:hypothetical protein
MKPIQKLFLLFFTASILLSCGKEKDEEPIEIPFTLEGNRIVMYATVNGVEGRYFWDTGGWETETTIPLDNLPVVENDPYYNHKRYYIKDGIVINGHRLKTTSIITNLYENIPGAEVGNSIFKNEGFDGVLGYYIFSGYWCELSFTESKIILHKNKPEKFSLSAGGHVDEWGSPCITVNINGTIPLSFFVDTGSPNDFGFPTKFMQYIRPAEYREILTVYTLYDEVLDVFETHYEIPVHSITMLDDVFADKFIITRNIPSERKGLIGIEYLQYYDLLFDITYNNEPKSNWHLWELYYIPRFPDLDKNTIQFSFLKDTRSTVGLTHIFTEQGRFLTRVWKPSVAYNEYGLTSGMTITHINGVFINLLNDDERSQLFSKLADDDNCEITVIDLDSRQRTIKRRKQ